MKAIHGLTALAVMFGSAAWAGPEVVTGPGADPDCFAPWNADTKYFQWEEKEGPYRIAVVNGFVGNTWRIQMIKTAKAFAEEPGDQGQDQGVQGRLDRHRRRRPSSAPSRTSSTRASTPSSPSPCRPKASTASSASPTANNVVIVPFDNVLDTDAVMQVNEDQLADGPRLRPTSCVKELGAKGKTSGKILEVRGLPATRSTATARSASARSSTRPAATWEIVEVVGNWDDGTAQKVTADAIAVHGKFDGVFTQGGSTGTVQALIDAKHPFVPMAGEAENGFRKLDRRALRRGPEGPLDRPVAGPRRHLDEGGDLGARGQRRCRSSSRCRSRSSTTRQLEGRRELLVRPARQLLHRQRIPALRREHHGAGDHGADRRRTCSRPPTRRSGAGPDRPAPLLPFSTRRGSHDAATATPRRHSVELSGVSQVLRRRPGARRCRLRLPAGLDPRRPRRERRRQVDPDQDHRPAWCSPTSGAMTLDGSAGAPSPTRRRPTRRHRLRLPGTVADARPVGRRQHLASPIRRAASA